MKYFFFGSALVAAVVVVLIGLSVQALPEDEVWVYRYQPLAAGFLAVAAAALTVVAMFAVDKRQQDRHDKLIDLSIRPDRLRVERIAPIAISEIVAMGAEISHAQAVVSDSGIDNILSTHQATLRAVERGMRAIDQTSPIRDLFDAKLEIALLAAGEAGGVLTEPRMLFEEGQQEYRLWRGKNPEGDYAGHQVKTIVQAHERYRTGAIAFNDAAQIFADHLQRLIGQYRRS